MAKKSNPLNPLDWLRATQDWFTRTERSSGFRSYLIFLILIFTIACILLKCFQNIPGCIQVALLLVKVSTFGFIALFAIKAFQDPDFARSETHVQRMKKFELEQMGTESDTLDGAIVEQQVLTDSVPEPLLIEDAATSREEAQR